MQHNVSPAPWRTASLLFNLATGILGTLAAIALIIAASTSYDTIRTLLPPVLRTTAGDSLPMVLIAVAIGFDMLSTLRIIAAYGLWRDTRWAMSLAFGVHLLFAVLETVAAVGAIVLGMLPVAGVVLLFLAANVSFVLRLRGETLL
jgi:hypothetical protein